MISPIIKKIGYICVFIFIVVSIAIYQSSKPASESDKKAKLVEFCELAKLSYDRLEAGQYISETIASKRNDCLYIGYDIQLYKPNKTIEFEAKVGTTTYKGKCKGETEINFCSKHARGKKIVFCPSNIIIGTNVEIDDDIYECVDFSEEFLIYCGLDSSCIKPTKTSKIKAFILEDIKYEG